MKKLICFDNFLMSLCVVVVFFTSCKKDEIKETAKAIAPTVSATTISAGGTITFTDNSTGVVSRSWTFFSGNPSTSSDKSVTIIFATEGPVICTLQDNLNDGTVVTQNINIQVGAEIIPRYSGGFEGDTCLKVWSYWCPSKVDSAAYNISVDKTQGANNTARCLKIVVNASGHEIQLFSVPTSGMVNAWSLAIDPNTKYIFSYWVKSSDFIGYINTSNNDGTFAHDIVNKSSDDPVQANRQAWGDYCYGNMAISSTWTQVTQSFGPTDLYGGVLTKNAYAWFKFVPTKTGTFYIDEVSLKPVQ